MCQIKAGNVSKEEIAFSLCDEKNAMEGLFRDSLNL